MHKLANNCECLSRFMFMNLTLTFFTQISPTRWRVAVLLGAVLWISGCAGSMAYREGNQLLNEGKVEQGLLKLEEAVKLEPKNAEYRIALSSRRAGLVNRLLATAEANRREGRLSEAEKSYRQVQGLDPNQLMATQGLQAVVAERKHKLLIAEAEVMFKRGKPEDYSAALEKLRPVLQEEPKQKDALNLKERIDEAAVKLVKTENRLAQAYRRQITLEFRDASLRSVFDVIAKVSGLNFFFDKDMRPDLKASILTKNTPIEDAVRLLLVTNQLEQKILNDNSILIYPNTPQKLKDYQTLSIRTFFLTNADVKAVSNTIKTILKTKDLVIDERLGLIILRDTPEVIRMAEKIVALQDLGDPEVVLDVEVLEIKRSRLLELGINWPSQLTLSPLQSAGVPFTVDDLRAINKSSTQVGIGNVVINARKEDADGNILANPRIRVRNKEKAKVLIGDRVPVITTTSNSTGFISESVNYVDVGLKLEVEPTIYLDEEVAIKVNLEVSSLVREVLSKSGSLSYQIGTRGANTVLRLKDGETQVLAGLISDEDRSTSNKVPGLGDLPLLGRLFGSQKDDTQRSEILLSITPRIVRSIRRPDLLTAEFESGTETNIGRSSLFLSSADSSSPTLAVTPPLPATTATPDNGTRTVPPISTESAVSTTTGSPTRVVVPGAGSLALTWQTPVQIKAGEQFSAVLRVNSQDSLRGLPMLIGFDPQTLQVVSAIEGDFFKQAGGQSTFSQRVDPAQGKIFIAAIRQNATGNDAGINGSGSLVTVTFKALKANPQAKIQLLSATPEPSFNLPLSLPIEQLIRILP